MKALGTLIAVLWSLAGLFTLQAVFRRPAAAPVPGSSGGAPPAATRARCELSVGTVVVILGEQPGRAP